MTGLTLEPLAVRQTWAAEQPAAPDGWAALFADYLSSLARACAEAGPCVIGHIKLLALFDNHAYLRVSAVSAAHPPTVTGTAPEGMRRIDTTLNVLVYGLPRDTLIALVSSAAAEVAARRGITYTEEPLSSNENHTEGTHHAH